MSEKLKNFIVRAITGAFFVAIMVTGLLNATAMIVLFAFISGATILEYTGLVNNHIKDRSIVSFQLPPPSSCISPWRHIAAEPRRQKSLFLISSPSSI